jgi:hypothetical protein
MRILALDISSKCGWTLLEGEPGQTPKLIKYGLISVNRKITEFGPYPFCYLLAAQAQADMIFELLASNALEIAIDAIVIEETNLGRARYTQKYLEFLHACVLQKLLITNIPVHYINTGDWRKKVGAVLTKEDKKLNAIVRKAKRAGNKTLLKSLGVRGKVGKKHVALRFVNNTYNLNLKMKDNDSADAVCLGVSFFLGVNKCTGV